MLELFYSYKGQPRSLYVKSEHYNLTSSMIDRMALYVLHQAYRQGHIQPSDRIVEVTGGSCGIAFSAVGRALGHPVTIIIPTGISQNVSTSSAASALILSYLRKKVVFWARSVNQALRYDFLINVFWWLAL